MPSSTSTAPHVPIGPGRRLARGSALGMGLLVASGVVAPAALAEEDDATTGEPLLQEREEAEPVSVAAALEDWDPAELTDEQLVPSFGVGKAIGGHPLVVGIHPVGAAPADLDLGGAVLAFRDVAPAEGEDDLAAVCVTDADGTCAVDYPDEEGVEFGPSTIALEDGVYVIEQVTGVEGLERAEGVVTTFEMGTCYSEQFLGCILGIGHDIPNVSQFHTAVVTTVVADGTGAPLAGAGYRLSGPDYRHRPGYEEAGDCQVAPELPGDEVITPELPPDLVPLGGEPLREPAPEEDGDPATTDAGTPELEPIDPDLPGEVTSYPATTDPDTGTTDGGTTDLDTSGTDTQPAGDAEDLPPVAEAEEATAAPRDRTVATSGADGVLQHVGCFLPGTWTLEPVTTPADHEPQPATVVLGQPAWDDESGTWDRVAETTVRLGLVDDSDSTDGPDGPVVVPPAPPTVGTPSGDGAGGPGPGPGTGDGTGGTGGSTGTGTSGNGSTGTSTGTSGARPAAPGTGVVPSAEPAPAAVPPAASRPKDATTARPPAAAAPAAQPAPGLETQGSSALVQAGVVALGIVFVALVFFLVLVLRRRARRQHG